jgi:hypothetical protein
VSLLLLFGRRQRALHWPPRNTNPLFDGSLHVTIGGVDVTADVLPGLVFGSSNPGGFGNAAFKLRAVAPFGPYASAVAKGAAVTITHANPPISLYEGVVTNDISHAVLAGGTVYYDVTCGGLWWLAGQRQDFAYLPADVDVTQWWSDPLSAQVYKTTLQGMLQILLDVGQSCSGGYPGAIVYWLHMGMGAASDQITTLLATLDVNVTGTNWHAEIDAAANPWSNWTTVQAWTNQTVAAGTAVALTIPAGSQAIRLRLYSDVNVPALAAPQRYATLLTATPLTYTPTPIALSAISVASPTVVTTATAHGLRTGDRVFITGSNSTPSIDGWQTVTVTTTAFTLAANVTVAGTSGAVYTCLRVDRAMAEVAGGNSAVTTGLATSVDIDPAGVGNLNWGLAARPSTDRASAIDALALTSADPLLYGFWDGGKFTARADAGADPARTYVFSSQPNWQPGVDVDVFADAQGTPTHVKVVYRLKGTS